MYHWHLRLHLSRSHPIYASQPPPVVTSLMNGPPEMSMSSTKSVNMGPYVAEETADVIND